MSISLQFVNADSAANLMYRPSWRSIIGQLKIEVCMAIGLEDKDDYRVQLSVEGRQESTFEVRAKKPAWNEIFVFEITEVTTQVRIEILFKAQYSSCRVSSPYISHVFRIWAALFIPD